MGQMRYLNLWREERKTARMENNFIALNIREYLQNENLGEERLQELLSEFSCPKNQDVERFLKEQAIDFTKKHQSVTYLLLSPDDAALLGYFTITVKPLEVRAEPFSNTMRKRFARFSEFNSREQTYNMAAYLIAQLGKNFDNKVLGRITGAEILELANDKLASIQYDIGGMVSFVEADDNRKLLSFYENHGYKRFDTRLTTSKDEQRELIQLLKLI